MPKTYFKSGAESITNTPGEPNARAEPVDITTQQLVDSIVYLLDKGTDTCPDNFIDEFEKLIELRNFFQSDPQKRIDELEFLVKVINTNSEVEITEYYDHLRPIRNLLLLSDGKNLNEEERKKVKLALTSELEGAKEVLNQTMTGLDDNLSEMETKSTTLETKITNIDNRLNALFPAVRPKPNPKIDISLTKAHVHVR
jgi:hypothetical protein